MERSTRLHPKALKTTLFLLFCQSIFAQNITYQNPADFYACDQAVFSITVQNTTGATLNSPMVTVNFTTTLGTSCGIQYVQGTVTGGVVEGNLSNLSAPQFLLPNLSAGASLTFGLQVGANCQTVACIDNAEVFVNNINLSWAGGSTSVTTNPYVIERALLVITGVMNTVMAGSRGDVLQRKINIRNTRPGALSSFTFKDVHQPGISISSPQGTVVPSPPGSFELSFGPSDFTAIGDGDGLFEFNETIVITENILITTCGVDENSAVSNITVGWGCGGTECQQVSVNAVVTFQAFNKIPQLAWEPIISVPECFCGPNGHAQGMKITNVGTGSALDVTFRVTPTLGYLPGAVDIASIRVDSLNIPIGFVKNTFTQLTYAPPCDAPPNLANSFNVVIASLAPGASVIVKWDLYYCRQGCNQPSAGWEYTYSYFKECPPNIFVQNTTPTVVGESGLKLNTTAQISGDSAMMDGQVYTVFYEVNYDSLALLDDELTLQIELPCGAEWLPSNQMLLNGQAPISISLDDMDTVVVLTVVYDLPLSSNTGNMQFDILFDCEAICLDGAACELDLETSCGAHCPIGYVPSYRGEIKTTISKCGNYPLDCNIQSCIDFQKEYECAIDSVCVDAPPGYLRYDFSALRKNYGLPDNNNDRIADATTGLPNLSLVARQRFIAGDTIQAIVRGAVVIDQPGATLPLGLLQLGFFGGNLIGSPNRDSLFNPNNLKEVGSLLRIHDKSAGVWYDCPNPAFTTDSKVRYNYDLSQAYANCMPPGFALDHGDSLEFVGNYRIGYNIKWENDGQPLLGNIIVEPKVFLFNADTSEYTLLNCRCSIEELLLSAYEFTITPGTFGMPPCEPSTFNTASLVRLQLHEGNFFPFEHRNIMVVEDLHLTLPPSVEVCTTRMVNLRLQDGAQLFAQQLFPPNFVNGQYLHNLIPFQTPSLDEGFSATFQYIFKNACTNKFSMPMVHGATVNFAPGLPELVDPLDFTIETNALRPLIANLAIDAPLYDLTSFSNQLLFDFLLKNTPTIVGNQTSGPALNAWLYVTSQTGLVTGFQLINQTTGLPVPMVNGVWQLGTLPENPTGFPYRLLATNNSCVKENLQINFGWNCDPYQSTVQSPCYEQVRPITIESPPGEIDMLVTSPIVCSDLCDTIPYHSLEVFNAQLGAVYDLRVKTLVPPGLNVIPGSCVVEYPTGSGLLYPIGDPTVLSAGVVEWNLSMLFDSIAGGLPGVSQAPFNSLTLRFLGETTCDFIADAYLLFIAAAKQNCGTPTNTIAKPGDPLCIEGVSTDFTMNINAVTVPGFGCNNDVGFEVSLSASDTLPPGACLILTLPPGITYQIGSCQNLCSTGFNCTPTIDGSFVTWQLPAGILPNQILCFKFNTQGWAGLGCENGVVLFRSAAQTQAICALTGDSCSTKVSTGSLILPFDVMRPEYDLTNFNITATAAGPNDLVNFSVNVTNNGAPNQPPLLIEFYLDTDGDGDGDQLVHTANYTSLIAAGQTVTVTGSFTLSSTTNLCALVALIDPTQQCACSGDLVQVATPIEYQTGQNWTVCSGVDQPIGVAAMPGFDYQWTPVGCLANPQSPMTIFNCVNNGFVPESYLFVLAEGNGFCEIQNQISVTVQPVPGIAYADSPICQGESANLAATDGVSFLWQGPGIAQPTQQIITVTPMATSQYSVTVTDAFNCSGTGQTTVVVAPLPVVNAGADASYCPGQLAMLNGTINPNFDYLWSPQTIGGLPALSNPAISNPVVLTNQTTTFSLTILDNNGCSAMDAVTVSFADSLLIVMPADLTICTGNTATLTVTSNVAANFTWTPSGTCVNPPTCSSLLVAPTSTTTYFVIGTSADGCIAAGSVTVTVVSDQIVTTGPPVEICEGETTTIFGQVVSAPGVYCDTITIGGGCDSLYCVELLVKPGIDTMLVLDTICLGESVVFEGQTFTEEGEYCVSYPAPNGCDSTICLNLTVLDTAVFEIQFATDTLNLGDSLTLSIAPGGYTSILWMANDSLLADCTDSLSCTVFPTENTTYSVTVATEEGCGGSAGQAITVIPACDPEKVEVPNAFSPNGDSKNDVFRIVGPGSEAILNMRIWNRWGQKVYDGPGPWDGSQDGKPAASDVYVYLIKVGCAVPVEGREKVLKGDVTLLR